MGGKGRSVSSKFAVRDHRWKPWDSPTGLREKGGVANEEFVVSVRESALGEVDVMTRRELVVGNLVPFCCCDGSGSGGGKMFW